MIKTIRDLKEKAYYFYFKTEEMNGAVQDWFDGGNDISLIDADVKDLYLLLLDVFSEGSSFGKRTDVDAARFASELLAERRKYDRV